MSKFRIGIVGCGGIANGKHLPSLSKLSNDVELVAFCDLIVEKAEKAAKEYGIPGAKVCTDYREIANDPTIDIVHVCTPNRSHSEISCACLMGGKHVMCEKPMAKTPEDAKKMLDAAKASGKTLTIGYQTRQYSSSRYLKKAVDRGDLGEVYFAKAHAIRRRAVPTWGVFLNEYEQGGGPLIDIGTHALDLTLWLMDNYEPYSVTGATFRELADTKNAANAWGPWDPEKFTVEDSAFGFIKMKNGALIELESSWAINMTDIGEACTTLCGTKAGATTKGGLAINGEDNSELYTKKLDPGSGVAFFDVAGDDPAAIEAYQWIQALKNGVKPTVLPEQAYVVTQILDAIYQSAKTGKTIYFD